MAATRLSAFGGVESNRSGYVPLPAWHTAETYLWRGLHGLGVSASSNRSVLEAAGQLYLSHGLSLVRDQVVERALRVERALAGGRAIAAQDVATIAYGGAQQIRTAAAGAIGHRQIGCSAAWLGEHLLFAYDPRGQRHDAPGLLDDLFAHPKARDFVAEISKLALAASDALRRHDLPRLAGAVKRYVAVLDRWTNGRLINQDAARVAAGLELEIRGDLLAWKPPGAGAASSLVALVGGDGARAATAYLENVGWTVVPVRIAGGLEWRWHGPDEVHIVAGHRVDLIGAADLGQDPAIATDGICVAVAIEPLCELTIRRAGPDLAMVAPECADPAIMLEGSGI